MAASFCRKSFFNLKNCSLQNQKRTAYIVLMPETPKDVSVSTLASLENLPEFSKLNQRICNVLFFKLNQQFEVESFKLKEQLKSQNLDTLDIFEQFFKPLNKSIMPLLSMWGVVKTLHFSNSNKLHHNSFFQINQGFCDGWNEKFNSCTLYNACKNLLEKNIYTGEEKRLLEKCAWQGVQNGFEVNKKCEAAFENCCNDLNMQKKVYEDKIKASKMLFKQVIYDEAFAKTCPLDLLRNTVISGKDPMEGPWVITLEEHIYNRFLEYCNSREARKNIWLSYNQLGSIKGDQRCKVVTNFEAIRNKREEYAKLLGFESYGHLTVKNKMAGTVENVQRVLSEILESAKQSHEKEINELERFAFQNGHNGPLEMWDVSYWKRIYLKRHLGLDEISLADYFPLHQVLLGLISLCEHLFGIIIEEQPSVESWDADVRYFRILDATTKNFLGGFYLDPYAKIGKNVGPNGSGLFVAIRPKSKMCNSYPLSALIFSFNPPDDEKPSLLYFRDVTYLFEKFGQVMQHTLSEMNYSDISGLTNIEWDAIDVCKYFLKFWLMERGTLESISGHYQTGEPLSAHALENLCFSSKHMFGTKLCHLIYLSNLDLELHIRNIDWIKIVQDLWPKHLLFQLIPLDYHVYGFRDIISGPLACCFYSYVWSLMLAADIFNAFEEVGFRKQEEISLLGKRFRSTYFSLGGGCDAKEIFRKFRGRDPDTQSLKKLFGFCDSVLPEPERKIEYAFA